MSWRRRSRIDWGRLGMKCEWSTYTVQQLIDMGMIEPPMDGNHGAIHPKTSDYVSNGIPFIMANDLVNGKVNFQSCAFITETQAATLRKGFAKPGDVLLTHKATIGRTAIVPDDYNTIILTPQVTYYRVIKGLNRRYLKYYFDSNIFQQLFSNWAGAGSTRAYLGITAQRKLPIIVPPIEVQDAIANICGSFDDKIELNNKINENLEQQARALYEAMFTNNPNLKITQGVLSDIAVITMGQSPSGSSYNEDGNGDVFYQGRAEFGFRFPTRRLFTTEPKRMAEANDVLLSVRAPVGDLNVAYEQCCVGRGLSAIHSKNDNSSFLLYTMFVLKPQLDIFNGEGTVFGSINRDGLSNLPIDIPCAEEITKFEMIVRPMDDLIRTNYEENCRLQMLRDSLLPRLMSGEIDIEDVNI